MSKKITYFILLFLNSEYLNLSPFWTQQSLKTLEKKAGTEQWIFDLLAIQAMIKWVFFLNKRDRQNLDKGAFIYDVRFLGR